MNNLVGQVVTFKLNSGEELIAKIRSVTDNTVTLTEPVSVAPGPQGMGLVPSMFTVAQNSDISLNLDSVALYAKTDDNIETKYIEATTGLTVPEKKIITG